MAKPKREFPNISNATMPFLIDEIARLRDEQKDLEALEGFYKEALKSRLVDDEGKPTPLNESNKEAMGGKVFKGTKNEMEIQYVAQARFDSTRFKADHPDLAAKYTKVIDFNQFKFKPIETAAKEPA